MSPTSALAGWWSRAEDSLSEVLQDQPQTAILIIIGCLAIVWTIIFLLATIETHASGSALQ